MQSQSQQAVQEELSPLSGPSQPQLSRVYPHSTENVGGEGKGIFQALNVKRRLGSYIKKVYKSIKLTNKVKITCFWMPRPQASSLVEKRLAWSCGAPARSMQVDLWRTEGRGVPLTLSYPGSKLCMCLHMWGRQMVNPRLAENWIFKSLLQDFIKYMFGFVIRVDKVTWPR